MRTSQIATILAWAPFVLAQDIVAPTSPKRGLCYVKGEDPKDDKIWDNPASDLTWYYNYASTPVNGLDDRLQFVPMLWDASSAGESPGSFYNTVKGLQKSGKKIEYVLGFNEPDGCENGGSCIDADVAAQAWISEIEPLKDLGIRLGAPAVTGSPRGLGWLQDFYTACDGGCTTDFLPIHWYGNFEGMASYIGQVNATYQNMSMWVTEFGYPNQASEDTETFFNQSVTYLDRLDYVTHYSWFGAFRADVSNVGRNSALLSKKGELTDIGTYYMGGSEAGKAASSASELAVSAGWSAMMVAAVFWNFA